MGAMTETLYDRIGGEATIRTLVRRFYEGVAEDELLRPMYPEEDLEPAQDRLALFLMQYWGGPHTYNETRGHPRLRMRHVPFRITDEAARRWLHHMTAALDSLELDAEDDAAFRDYVTRAAHGLINTFDHGQGPALRLV